MDDYERWCKIIAETPSPTAAKAVQGRPGGEVMTESALHKWANATPARRRAFAEEGLIVDVCEQIHAIMQSQGITNADLARKVGCSRANINGILSGRQNLTLRTIAAIALALDVEVRIAIIDDKEGAGSTTAGGKSADETTAAAEPARRPALPSSPATGED